MEVQVVQEKNAENCENSLVDEIVISLRNIGSEKILVLFFL